MTRSASAPPAAAMRAKTFAAKGVLPLEFKPTHSVGDLLVQHLDELEREAEAKGGVPDLLEAHFARVYKMHRLQASTLAIAA